MYSNKILFAEGVTVSTYIHWRHLDISMLFIIPCSIFNCPIFLFPILLQEKVKYRTFLLFLSRFGISTPDIYTHLEIIITISVENVQFSTRKIPVGITTDVLPETLLHYENKTKLTTFSELIWRLL